MTYPITVTTGAGSSLVNAPALEVPVHVSLSPGDRQWVSDDVAMRGCEVEVPQGGEYVVVPYVLPLYASYGTIDFNLSLNAQPAPATLTQALAMSRARFSGLRLTAAAPGRGTVQRSIPRPSGLRWLSTGRPGTSSRLGGATRRPAPAAPLGEIGPDSLARIFAAGPRVRPGVVGLTDRLSRWGWQARMATNTVTARAASALGRPRLASLLDGSSCSNSGAVGDTVLVHTVRLGPGPDGAYASSERFGQVFYTWGYNPGGPDSTYRYHQEPWTVAATGAHVSILVDSTFVRATAGQPAYQARLDSVVAGLDATLPGVLSRYGLSLPDADGNGRVVVLVAWSSERPGNLQVQRYGTQYGAYGRVGCDNGEGVLIPSPLFNPSVDMPQAGATDGVVMLVHEMGHLMYEAAHPPAPYPSASQTLNEGFAGLLTHFYTTRADASPFEGNRQGFNAEQAGHALETSYGGQCFTGNTGVLPSLAGGGVYTDGYGAVCWFSLRLATALHAQGRTDAQVANAFLAGTLDPTSVLTAWSSLTGTVRPPDAVYGDWLLSWFADDTGPGVIPALQDPVWNVPAARDAWVAHQLALGFAPNPAIAFQAGADQWPAQLTIQARAYVRGGEMTSVGVDARNQAMRVGVLNSDGVSAVADPVLHVGVVRLR